MFDQLKVNQNNIISLLKTPDRENSEIQQKKSANEFFSLVMGQAGFNDIIKSDNNQLNQIAERRNDYQKFETVKAEENNFSSDMSRANSTRDREGSFSGEEINPVKMNGSDIKNDRVQETSNKEIKKPGDSSDKENKQKKTGSKESDDESYITNQLFSERNIKNLMEIIKAAVSGNKKAEEDGFRKLLSNLKLKSDKENISMMSSFSKNEMDKNQKTPADVLNHFTRDLKDSISREILKSIENRKPGSRNQIINDKELKEISSNIIDGIRKNKARENVKHELKTASADDTKNDKKTLQPADQTTARKIEITDDASSDKNGARDKNSSRENFSYNSGRVEFSSKSAIEKMDHASKMPDFKENLQEIIDKARITVRDSRNGTFTVKLNPQELGNVNVNLIMENGVINGKFLVDNEDAKSMLLSNLNDLKYQLEGAGLSVGEFSVNVSDQREKYLMQKDNETLNTLSFLNSDKEVIAAVDQYNQNTAAHTGHINMVI